MHDFSLDDKSLRCRLNLRLGGRTDQMSSLSHITELQSLLTFSHVEDFDSVTSRHSTKAYKGWIDLSFPHHLGPFRIHTDESWRHLNPCLRCFVKELSDHRLQPQKGLEVQVWQAVRLYKQLKHPWQGICIFLYNSIIFLKSSGFFPH